MKRIANEARQLNLYLDTLTSNVLELEQEMVQDGKTITIDRSLKNEWALETMNGHTEIIKDPWKNIKLV